MNKNFTILLLLLIALPIDVADARARYAGQQDMIREAEAIAIVNITHVEDAEMKGNWWSYLQRVAGVVEQSLKGDIEGKIEIFGMETFICARCEFSPGRFLLFLRKGKEEFWHGSNWHLGIRPISDENKIEWFRDGESLFDMELQDLSSVIQDIESRLE